MRAKTIQWQLYCHPSIRVAGRFPFSPKLADQVYRHPTFALHQHHYRGRIDIGGSMFQLHPGDITLTPPETNSRYEIEGTGYHWCIHFKSSPVTAEKGSFRLPVHLGTGSLADIVAERFRAIAEAIKGSASGTKPQREMAAAAASGMLQNLLLKLGNLKPGRHKRPYARRSDAVLDAARQYLDQAFQQTIDVEGLARSSGLSRNYFSEQFQIRFGTSVQSYILHRRMELARNLLLSTTLPVKEIAFECGIHDPHYFNKQFRRATGASPSHFRAGGGKVR